MASKFDGKTKDGINYTILRDENGNPRKASNGRELRSYTWRYRDTEGKSRQITGRDLNKIRAKRDEIRDNLHKGSYVDPRNGRMFVKECAEEWLASIKPFTDYNTWKTHEKRVRVHVVPKLGHLRMHQLDARTIEKFQTHVATGRSMKTVQSYMTTFNQIINYALNKGVLTVDPRRGVTKIKIDWQKKKVPFEPHEIAALEDAATGQLRRLIKIKRGTGLRISELLALDETQIDWTEGAETVHIDRQIGKDDQHGTIIKDPKSAKGNRVIPLPAWVVAAIKEEIAENPPPPRTMAWVHRDRTVRAVTARFIFHDATGAPILYYRVRNAWNDVVKVSGLQPKGDEGTNLHRLRHTYAGDLIRQGVDIYVVSRIMGHSSVRVTEMYYAHLRKETLETAREAMNALQPNRPPLALVQPA
jgi:integrase